MKCCDMTAAMLRNRVTIQQEGARSSDGQGGYTQTWAALASDVPAYVVQRSARESGAAGRLEADATTEFTIRYRSDVNEAMRILFRGVVYNIRGIENVEFRDRWMRITAERGVAT